MIAACLTFFAAPFARCERISAGVGTMGDFVMPPHPEGFWANLPRGLLPAVISVSIAGLAIVATGVFLRRRIRYTRQAASTKGPITAPVGK